MDKFEIYVTAVNDTGVTEVIKSEDGTEMLVSGMAFNVMYDLKLMLNFSLKFLPANDFFPEMEPLKNSSIGFLLTKGQADIGLGYLYYIIPRLRFGNPMVPLSVEKFDIFFQKPSRNAFRNVFSEPFSTELIICIVAFVILIGISIAYLTKKSSGFAKSFLSEMQEGMTWTIAMISQQGFIFQDMSNSIRILILTGTYLALLLNACYSAAILTFLTVDNGVISYEHILRQGFSLFVRATVNSTLVEDKHAKKLKLLKLSRTESIKLLLMKNDHAHLDTQDLFYISSKRLQISDQDVCEKISKAPFSGGLFRAGFYCRKDFRYKTLFNSKLMQITEMGLTKRYRDRYIKETVVECPRTRKKYQDELGLENVIGVFGFLVGAMILALIILLREKHIYSNKFYIYL